MPSDITPIEVLRGSGKSVLSSAVPNKKITRSASFPKTPGVSNVLINATLDQTGYEHQKLVLTYVGALTLTKSQARKMTGSKKRSLVNPGDPVVFTWSVGKNKSSFYGYVYSVKHSHATNKNLTTVVCLGASSILQNHRKRVFRNVSASDVVKQISAEHKSFSVSCDDTKAKYRMLSQSGLTDWQMLRQLAAKTGRAMWVDKTTLFFVNLDSYIAKKIKSIRTFSYANANPIGVVVRQSIYSFVATSIPLHATDGGEIDITVGNKPVQGLSLEDALIVPKEEQVGFLTAENFSMGVNTPKASLDYGETYGVVTTTTVDALVDETVPTITEGA